MITQPIIKDIIAKIIEIPLKKMSRLFISKGIKVMKSPNISAVFAVTEPIALPTAISTFLVTVA